eukprot:1030591-Rhodomonas_salina.1
MRQISPRAGPPPRKTAQPDPKQRRKRSTVFGRMVSQRYRAGETFQKKFRKDDLAALTKSDADRCPRSPAKCIRSRRATSRRVSCACAVSMRVRGRHRGRERAGKPHALPRSPAHSHVYRTPQGATSTLQDQMQKPTLSAQIVRGTRSYVFDLADFGAWQAERYRPRACASRSKRVRGESSGGGACADQSTHVASKLATHSQRPCASCSQLIRMAA